jgi:hypothetical protein
MELPVQPRFQFTWFHGTIGTARYVAGVLGLAGAAGLIQHALGG